MKRELRLLVTSACNYRCGFCHNEGVDFAEDEKLSADDYIFLYKVFNEMFPNDEITITGGEPLVRSDIGDILKAFKSIDVKTTLVTNGSLIFKNIDILTKNVSRVNVSLHSMNSKLYQSITGTNKNALFHVKEGLAMLKSTSSNIVIRLNSTFVKGANNSLDAVQSIISFASTINASVKFIELYPKSSKLFVPIEIMVSYLEELGYTLLFHDDRQSSFQKDEEIVYLTKIFCAYSEHFKNRQEVCRDKQDLFITPSGKIKTCMNNNFGVSIYEDILNRDSKKLKYNILRAINLFGNCTAYGK
ncbi:MAG: radical SAM protein [Alphaproteobacteria bacterium]